MPAIKLVPITAAIAIVIVSARSALKTSRVERAKRVKIEENLQLNLRDIARAGAVIQDRIRRGVYDGAPLHKIMTDMQFEQIIAREQ